MIHFQLILPIWPVIFHPTARVFPTFPLRYRKRPCSFSTTTSLASPGLVAQQLLETVEKFHCESLLLDFQRPHSPEIEQMVQAIQAALPCPLALPPAYAPNCDGPVFLPPCPLHIPLEEYLSCWSGREIWLEAALCQEDVRITSEGSVYIPHFPSDGLQGGFFDQTLCCNYRSAIEEDAICFTLFDTNESLSKKLDRAQALEVNRAVGLWQELSKKHHL